MRYIKTAARWLFIICIPLLLLTASISIAANCPALYTRGFHTYHIAVVTGLDETELEKAAAGLRDYFNSGDELINLTVIKDGIPMTLFNERERAHLKDVKDLFRLGYYVAAGTLAYCLVFIVVTLWWWRDHRQLWQGFWGGGILTLALMVVLGVTIAVNFDAFFRQFHLLSFANDLWQLNPATDYLIMLFPRNFWFDAALFCAAGTAAGAVILAGAGWWCFRHRGNAV